MKTSVTVTRKMGQFDVHQRNTDSMFNATTLLKQWNEFSGMKKEIGHFLENDSTKEFVNTIINRESAHRNSELPQNQVITKTRCKTNSDGSKEAGSTWMHPLLFIDFAMWINPSFKYDVLKFVYDEMIKYRNDAGDAYIEMSSAISKIVSKYEMPEQIQKVARALNHIVYGEHKSGIRNDVGDESKARELWERERDIAKLINGGFIRTVENLMDYLRSEWRGKYEPKLLRS